MMRYVEGNVQPISFKGLKVTCGPRYVVSRVGRETWGDRRRERSLQRRKEDSRKHKT